MREVTARQREIYLLVEECGSQNEAARRLGITQGAVLSALRAYRRNSGMDEPLPRMVPVQRHRLTQRAQLDAVAPELARLADQGAALPAVLEAILGRLDALEAEIHAWTARQPIYVEMRPRHQRVVDGGDGGQREAKRLRAVDGAGR